MYEIGRRQAAVEMVGGVGVATAGGEGDSSRAGEATRVELAAFELAPFADRRWRGPQAVSTRQARATKAAAPFISSALTLHRPGSGQRLFEGQPRQPHEPAYVSHDADRD